jgi:hypothetical protein
MSRWLPKGVAVVVTGRGAIRRRDLQGSRCLWLRCGITRRKLPRISAGLAERYPLRGLISRILKP